MLAQLTNVAEFILHPSSFIHAHKVALSWFAVLSAVMFFGTLLAIPWLLARIPADYFLRPHYYTDRWRPRHPILLVVFLAAKNLLGLVFVLAGVVMLVGPGQGILTILVGLLFLDFPGKRAMELWLVRRRPVIEAINWIRRKANRPPLELPGEEH